jgi:hypothetical protein
MKIASLFKDIDYQGLDIECIKDVDSMDVSQYDYIIISGGDGAIRRAVKALCKHPNLPPFIINPVGSFNVIAKKHQIPPLNQILHNISQNKTTLKTQEVYRLNDEVFLFSAGNMGDVQHIFISESIRVGWLKQGAMKYAISLLLLLPMHIVMTPFMLLSKERFFVFTPLKTIKKFGSFYGRVDETIEIDLNNDYNIIELDGDIVTIYERYLKISKEREVKIAI